MDIESYFRENNIRITKNRRIILDILYKSEGAVGAEYIYEKCKEYGDRVDLSTVYRTVELLEEKNILNKFPRENGSFKYILASKLHKHIIKCEFCDRKVEIDCPMIQVEEIIKSKTGFTFIDKDIKFKCVCDNCRKNNISYNCSLNKGKNNK